VRQCWLSAGVFCAIFEVINAPMKYFHSGFKEICYIFIENGGCQRATQGDKHGNTGCYATTKCDVGLSWRLQGPNALIRVDGRPRNNVLTTKTALEIFLKLQDLGYIVADQVVHHWRSRSCFGAKWRDGRLNY
jgi:hypothetical protein